jgi:hypothetical protein
VSVFNLVITDPSSGHASDPDAYGQHGVQIARLGLPNMQDIRPDGTDAHIELTDGTSFLCCFCHHSAVKGILNTEVGSEPRTPSVATKYRHSRALP